MYNNNVRIASAYGGWHVTATLLQQLSDNFLIEQLKWKHVLKANMYEKANSNFTRVLRWQTHQ